MLHVHNAGVPQVNGTYLRCGEHLHRDQYQNMFFKNVYLRRGSNDSWCFTNYPGDTGQGCPDRVYYYTGKESTGPFQLDHAGTLPEPIVTNAGSGWPMHRLHDVLMFGGGLAGLIPEGDATTALFQITGSCPKGPAVILTTGGMNPVHRGHVQLLTQARCRLENDGYAVIGMWLSPSHDLYVQPKAASLGTIGLSANFRIEVAGLSLADVASSVWESRPDDVGNSDAVLHAWMAEQSKTPMVASWEAQQVGQWPDFPEVAAALKTEIDTWLQPPPDANCAETRLPVVFYACGTDHAAKCGLYNGMPGMPDVGVVVVPRAGEEVCGEQPGKLVFVAHPPEGEVASFSSTKVREAIASQNWDYVQLACGERTAQFLSGNQLCSGNQQFTEDWQKLGVTPPKSIAAVLAES